MKNSSEFTIISRYFAPISDQMIGKKLSDDAAVLKFEEGKELVISSDMLISGVHFQEGESPDFIARKALRVNLSDIAAMGATPKFYLLSLGLKKDLDDDWVKLFCKGLELDQKEYSFKLIGGDTVSTKKELAISITILGEIENNKSISRSGAKLGDNIYVSGNIGDAFCGLKLLNSKKIISKKNEKFLVNRYRLPLPRVTLGQKLVDVANASIDVSDGLVADLDHICKNSRVGAELYLSLIPFSEEFKSISYEQQDLTLSSITWGDDYEILFTASIEKDDHILQISKELGIKITKIGKIIEEKKVFILDDSGRDIDLITKGYSHR